MDKMIIPFRYYLDPPAENDKWGLSVHGIGGYSGTSGEVEKKGRFFPHFALVYITEGSGTWINNEGISSEIIPGDCLLVIPGVKHTYFPDEKNGWSQYWILFNGYYADSLLKNQVFDSNDAHFHIGLHFSVTEKYETIKTMVENNSAPPFLYLSSTLYSLINQLWELKQRPLLDKTSSEISSAREFIEENWAGSIDYRQLAYKLNMSYSHFRRTFKQETGYSPHGFHISLKINKAKYMLDTSEMSVKQVAAETGFQDQYYFSRLFKSRTGIPPSKWNTF